MLCSRLIFRGPTLVGLLGLVLVFLQTPLDAFGRRVVAFENKVRVNALKCIEHDRDFVHFDYCRLKAVNRSLQTISLRAVLLKPPVTKSNVQFTMYKYASGYKPFVINVKVDMCKYLAGKKNRILDWAYDFVVSYTNMNHTCPYVDDMIVEKMPLSVIKLPSLFPDGDYRMDIILDAFDVLRATVQIYVTIKEN